jgi:RNA polymerase sigma-70 factor (ECF subfamily)
MNSEQEHNPNNRLLLRYQNGEEKALEMLIKRFHPVMVRAISYYTANSESVDDIAQDCWYSIIPKLADMKLKISFDAWALSIVRRRSIDWIRMRQRSRVREKRIHEWAESGSNHMETEDTPGLLERVLAEIRQLPPTRRMVLHLFYLENLSLQEIGELLDISTGTVKSRLFYARENLKKIITNPNEE